jgi:hypothetical protein
MRYLGCVYNQLGLKTETTYGLLEAQSLIKTEIFCRSAKHIVLEIVRESPMEYI